MIKESLKIHSKRQFEVKQKVSFTKNVKEVRYQVETYFFLPTALQINQHTYTAEKFLRSLKNYVRLRPPTQKLHTLPRSSSALQELKEELATLSAANETGEASLDRYENALKLFALTYKRSLRLAVKSLSKNKHKQNHESVEEMLEDTALCLKTYRDLAEVVKPLEEKLTSSAFIYCDEFMSIITTFYLKDIFLDPAVPSHDQIYALWSKEILYRKEHYPDSVPIAGLDNETVLYRWSILKKYVSRCLFLETKLKKGAPLLVHSLYGVAAAISMIFATVVAFMWQGKYGALSVNLFLALIVAYIFKDRIKDVAREQLARMFQKWIPNRRQIIYKDDKTPVGVCKESFRFIGDQQLPKDIWKMRQQSHWINLVNDHRAENFLLYKKEVQLQYQPQLFKQTQYSIMDITRFNITDFLKYIDNMFEDLPLIEDEDKRTTGEKIYHVYVIRRVLYEDRVASELARLVINAQGIKRLEIVQPMTTLDKVNEDDEDE